MKIETKTIIQGVISGVISCQYTGVISREDNGVVSGVISKNMDMLK